MSPATRRGFLATGTGLAVAGLGEAGATVLPEPSGGMMPAEPSGEVVLTVDGAIGPAGSAAVARFDIDTLLGLGRRSLRTATPFTDGEPLFEGVLAQSVMTVVRARGSRALARARNDYAIEIPLADFERWGVLLASHMDGRRLRLRDKGPLWVVYPWSQHPELDDRMTRQKSVWQLARLTIA